MVHFAIILSFAGTLATLLLYVGHFMRPEFNSDDAVLNLLAEVIHQQGRLLPSGWVTNNGDLMMPSGALLIAPLLAWWPNGFAVHAFASVVLSLLLLAIVAWFLRVARLSWLAVVVTLTLLASGFSIYFTLMVFGQTTYFWWPAGFILGAALLTLQHLSPQRGDVRRAYWPLVALFVLVVTLSFANPGRVAVMMVLPLYAFDRALAWNAANRSDGRCGVLLHLMPRTSAPIVLVLAWSVAFVAYRVLLHAQVISTLHYASNLQLTDVPGFLRHLRIFATGWFDYLGGSSYGIGQKPWEPLMRTLRTGLALAISAVAIVELRTLPDRSDPVRRALYAAFAAAVLPILLLFLLFKPLAQESSLSLRYFSVAYFILLLLCAWRIEQWLRDASRWTLGILAAGCIVVAAGAVHRMIPFGETFWTTPVSMPMRLGEILQREGLTWGYATWWNAGATTVMSDSAVRVSPLEITPQLLRPYPVMISRDWYKASAHRGSTFLALRLREATPAQLAYLEARLGAPQTVISEGDYRIQVYPRNITADFVCADAASMVDRALTEEEFDRLRIVSVRPFVSVSSGSLSGLHVRVRNDTDYTIASTGAHPVNIGLQLSDPDGVSVSRDWTRGVLDCPLASGEERTVYVPLPEAPRGSYRVTVDLVQEGVAWFADKGADTITLPLETP